MTGGFVVVGLMLVIVPILLIVAAGLGTSSGSADDGPGATDP